MKKIVLNKYIRTAFLMNGIFIIGSMYKLFFPNPPTTKPIIIAWVGFGILALCLLIKGYLDLKPKKSGYR